MKRLLWLSLVLWTGSRLSAGEFQTAAAGGELTRVQRLLEANPALVNQKDRGTTALHEAARKGHLAIVEYLVNNGADVNALDSNKYTPLRLAMFYKRQDIIALLRQHGGVEKVVAGSPTAVPNNAVAPKLSAGPTPTFTPTTPPAETVLPRSSRPPTGRAPSTLGTANPRTTLPAPDEPAARAASTPPRVSTPTQTASSTNKSVEELITELPTINDAARVGDTRTVQRLLELLPDLRDWIDDKGVSPLHVAAQYGQNAVVRQLLAVKVNPNMVSRLGYTPLHVVSQQGNAETVQLLVAARANPNASDKHGITPLHTAAKQGK